MGLLLGRIHLSWETRNGSLKFLAVYLCNSTKHYIPKRYNRMRNENATKQLNLKRFKNISTIGPQEH